MVASHHSRGRRRSPRRVPESALRGSRRSWQLIGAVAGVALLTTIIFAPVRNFAFVNYDDGEFVVNNPHVATGFTWENLRWALSHPYAGTGGPLTWISHMADVEFGGLRPGAHHVTSLALHAVNSALLLLVLTRLTGALGRSSLVAALFALHPLHVESVAWVAQRKDVLSTLFWLLAIWLYYRYVQRASWLRYTLVVVAAMMGLLSKPMVVSLPVILLLLDFWPLRRFDPGVGVVRALPRLAYEKLPLFILAVLTTLATFRDQQRLGAIVQHLPLSDRLANATVSYLAYLRQTFWPFDLAVFYPYRLDMPLGLIVLSALALFALTAAAMAIRDRCPYVTVGWLWYVVTLLPAIGIVQAGGHAMADRATYMPLVGLFILLVWAAHDVMMTRGVPRSAATAGAIVLVGACALLTRAQLEHWRDGAALWRRAVQAAPSARAHANLGVALAARGEVEPAIQHYRRAVDLDPGVPQVHNNLGLALSRSGRPAEAESHYREALRLDVRYASAHNNLGSLLAEQGRLDEAIAQYSEALRLDPGSARVRVNLAAVLADAERWTEASREMEEALRSEPRNAEWNYIAGVIHSRRGDTGRARSYFETALEQNPAHAGVRQALQEIDRRR